MKHTILLTGGNAAGKTTTIAEVMKKLQAEVAAGHVVSYRADNDNLFKGSADQQEAAVQELWLGPLKIMIMEGTRINTPLVRVAKRFPGDRKLHVFLALQDAEVMRAHLMARCAKKNKPFEAEYWTRVKCEYEGLKRYRNNFAKNGVDYKPYMIDINYEKQVQLVDDIYATIEAALLD